MKKTVIFLFALCLLVSRVNATPSTGGIGLMHVKAAKVLPKGHLQFYSGTQYYGKVASSGNDAYSLWNVQFFTSLNWGVSRHLEFAISPIIYQDTNTQEGNALDGQANVIDDIFVSAKIASFNSLESPFFFGGMLYTRIPTGEAHNIIYENYSAGNLEVGITGLASYYSNLTFPDEGWSAHFNLGYLNHNDVGTELTENPDDPKPTAMTSELLFGVGGCYPFDTFDFTGEINARYFLTRPPVTAYSREYVSYLTLGVHYKPYSWVSFDFGLDFKLLSGEDISEYGSTGTTSLPEPPEDFPNYPSWKGKLGVKLAILPTSLYATPEKNAIKQKSLQRKEVLQRMMDDQEDTESAEGELKRIKSERQKLEAELERLRKLIEEENN